MGESVTTEAPAPTGLLVPAWVCSPCGKLLGIDHGEKPKGCHGDDHVILINAATAQVDTKTGLVVAAQHL
jgi:hypothetical protein